VDFFGGIIDHADAAQADRQIHARQFLAAGLCLRTLGKSVFSQRRLSKELQKCRVGGNFPLCRPKIVFIKNSAFRF
jgi:hypothetical protein